MDALVSQEKRRKGGDSGYEKGKKKTKENEDIPEGKNLVCLPGSCILFLEGVAF